MMALICTVTLNPALDKILIVDEIRPGENNRLSNIETDVGGKGTHVSAVLSDLGVDNVATGILGGSTGRKLQRLLMDRGVACDFVWKQDYETRTSYIVIEFRYHRHFMLTEKGAEVDGETVDRLKAKVKELSHKCEYIVFSGGVCPGFDKSIYRELIEISNKNGVKSVLDASGEFLKEGIKSGPYMIKPNHDEFSQIMGKNMQDEREIAAHAKQLLGSGIRVVAVTLDRRGCIIVTKEQSWRIYPPDIHAVNTVGCGDVFLAAALKKIADKNSLDESFIFATALSATKAMQIKTSKFDLKKAQELIKKIKIEEWT
ncbi:MAG: hypothetical protein PWQ97_1424 [Tepidanaerobacteraceae bacterium]|nr:hypothetical protein [Tepidanaerobacteraceae bacterium]